MLILKRKIGDSITLEFPNGMRVVIEITELLSNAAKVGINAPSEVRILRTELIGRLTE